MKSFIRSSYLAIILLILYIPIAIFIFFSFNSKDSIVDFGGFSTRWYKDVFQNQPLIQSLITSLFVAVSSTIISLIIGVLAVVGLVKLNDKKQKKWLRIANIPLVNADIITAVSLMIVFIIAGLKFGIITLLAAHISFNVPYVIVTVLPFYKRIDKNIIYASQDLGSNGYQTFWKVVFPTILPSILTATTILFAMSFDDFIISYFTGGDQTNISSFIYNAKIIRPTINAIGTIMVLTIFTLIIIFNLYKSLIAQHNTLKMQVKNGEYKIKIINKKYRQIDKNYEAINLGYITKYTLNPIIWIKYKICKNRIHILKNQRYDIKINKLEQKIEEIRKKVEKDKNIAIRLQDFVFKQNLLKSTHQSLINSDNLNKAKKISDSINKLELKINKLKIDLEIYQDHKLYAQEKIELFNQQITNLNDSKKFDQLTIKQIKAIDNKIKKIKEKQAYVLKTKNECKLEANIEKLNKIKELKNAELYGLYEKFDKLQKRLYVKKRLSKNLNIVEVKKNLARLKVSKLEKDLIKIDQQQKKLFKKFFEHQAEVNYKSSNLFWRKSWRFIMISFMFLTSFIFLLATYFLTNTYDIVVGNWGEYIDPKLIKEFQEKTGKKINYQEYDSNEILHNKVLAFDYDIMVPSDYMAKKMILEGRIQEPDWDRIIPNNQKFDKNNIYGPYKKILERYEVSGIGKNKKSLYDYVIPYFFGDVRLVFNTNNKKLVDALKEKKIKVDKETGIIDDRTLEWDILWDLANKGFNVCLNDDSKNLFMYALKKLNKLNVSPETIEDVEKATEELKTLVKKRNVGLYTDEIIEKVKTGDFDVATIYGGDLTYATRVYQGFENDDDNEEEDVNTKLLAPKNKNYINEAITDTKNNNIPVEQYEDIEEVEIKNPFIQGVPKNGTNIWSDNIVISKKVRNIDVVYQFISFLYEKKSQFALISRLSYLSASNDAIDEFKEKLNKESKKIEKWFSTVYEPKVENENPYNSLLKDDVEFALIKNFNKLKSLKR